jgi:predicted amidophosphoribosyltransferase
MTLKLAQLSLLCRVCKADVPPSGRRGPRRTYCSEACKQAAYRGRVRGGRRRTCLDRDPAVDAVEVDWKLEPKVAA